MVDQAAILSHDLLGQIALLAFAVVMLVWTLFVVVIALRPVGDHDHALERAADAFADRMTWALRQAADRRRDSGP